MKSNNSKESLTRYISDLAGKASDEYLPVKWIIVPVSQTYKSVIFNNKIDQGIGFFVKEFNGSTAIRNHNLIDQKWVDPETYYCDSSFRIIPFTGKMFPWPWIEFIKMNASERVRLRYMSRCITPGFWFWEYTKTIDIFWRNWQNHCNCDTSCLLRCKYVIQVSPWQYLFPGSFLTVFTSINKVFINVFKMKVLIEISESFKKILINCFSGFNLNCL